MKSTAIVALVLVSALGLSGCSGDDEPEAAPSSDASASASPSAEADPGIISPELPEEPAFSVGPSGVIEDITVDSCDTEPGTVTASGTATNSGDFARDIVVTVNWAVEGTSDVVARGIAQLDDIEPGANTDWTLEAELEADQPVQCVPTALAGQLE